MSATGDLERYRTISTIGAGGMARVDLAEDTRLGREVALKRISGDADPTGLTRLRREALVGASVSHPNLVSIFDVVGGDDGRLVIVMEYVAGETLRDRLNREGRLAPREALRILGDVAAGLDAIHDRGIVHRDVKPSNVLLGEGGQVKVADLGIASVPDQTRITTSGAIVGSLSYMAPEQLGDAVATPAIDIYALAVLGYEMLSGTKARTAPNAVALAHAINTQPPPDLRDVWPEAPDAAAEVLLAGMARDPGDRPRSAEELVARLRSALSDDTTRQLAPMPEQRRPARRVGPAAAAVGAAGAAGAAGALAAAPAADAAMQQPAQADPGLQALPSRGAAARSGRARNGPALGAPARGGPPSDGRVRPGATVPPPRRSRGGLIAGGLIGLVAAAIALAVILGSGGSSGSRRAASQATTTHSHHRAPVASTPAASSSSGAASSSSTTPASGSASDSSSTASTSSSAAASSSTSSTAAAAAPTGGAGDPASAVRTFYGLSAAHNYQGAWALADPALRSQLGGYSSFAGQQSGDKSITVHTAQITSRTATTATVAFTTTSVRTDGTHQCQGSASLVRSGSGWLMHNLIGVSCT